MTEKQKAFYERNRHHWSDAELEYLRSEYPTGIGVDIADHLGISVSTVRSKAKELGLRGPSRCGHRSWQSRYVRNYRDERYKNYKAA